FSTGLRKSCRESLGKETGINPSKDLESQIDPHPHGNAGLNEARHHPGEEDGQGRLQGEAYLLGHDQFINEGAQKGSQKKAEQGADEKNRDADDGADKSSYHRGDDGAGGDIELLPTNDTHEKFEDLPKNGQNREKNDHPKVAARGRKIEKEGIKQGRTHDQPGAGESQGNENDAGHRNKEEQGL